MNKTQVHNSSEGYNERADDWISNLMFDFRAWYYKKYILRDVKGILEGNIIEKDNLSILNRGCGQGHKFEKIIQLFNELNKDAQYIGIEPSDRMREKAIKRLCLYEGVNINGGVAQKLENISEKSIDIVSDEQMHHHNTDEEKREIIKEAYRVLKEDGLFLILDTYEPENKFKKIIFDILVKGYERTKGSGPYYTHKTTDIIAILEQEGFEIIFKKGYKMGVGRLFGFDLTTQIIAIKKGTVQKSV